MDLLERLSSRLAERRAIDVALTALVLAIAAIAIHAHNVGGLTMPVPTGDEGYFIWQARAFMRSFSFIAPEVDATRPILLLPFVYEASLAVAFKVFGTSLAVARFASLAYVLTAMGFLAIAARRFAAPIMSLVLIGAFVLNSRFVVMANEVRMEGLFFAFLCLSLMLMQQQRTWMSLAVLSISPMVHPNGVLYLGPAILFAMVARQVHKTRPSRAVIVVLALSAAIWLWHGFYVLRYWEGFVQDSSFRFGEMANASAKMGMDRLKSSIVPTLELVMIAATLAIGYWRRVRIGYLMVFAIGAWLHARLRFEQPYEAFGDLQYLLVALAWLEIGASVLSDTRYFRTRLPFATGAMAVAMLLALIARKKIEGPFGYTRDLSVSGMHTAAPGGYFRDEDRAVLWNYVKSISPERPIVVEVYPWPDALLIADLSDERIRFQVPYYDPLFRPQEHWIWGYGPTPAPVPDLYLIHRSRFTPLYLKARPDAMIERALKHPEVEPPVTVLTRDSSETWYALRAKKQ